MKIIEGFQEKKMQRDIGEKIYEHYQNCKSICDDPGYVAYLTFCVLGGHIIQNLGMECFEKYIHQIIENNK